MALKEACLDRTRNYIAKDWFRALGEDHERAPAAKIAADALQAYLQEPGVSEPGKTLLVNSQLVE